MGKSDEKPAEEAFTKGNMISSEVMTLLREAGYDESDLEFMDYDEFCEALEEAGVEPEAYYFDVDD